MDKFAHKAATFALAYPFLVIGAATLILLTVNLLLREALGVDIVRAEDKDRVDEGHPDEQWDNAQRHDGVLAEEVPGSK